MAVRAATARRGRPPWGIDGAVEPHGPLPAHRQEPNERAEVRHLVLQRDTGEARSTVSEERFES